MTKYDGFDTDNIPSLEGKVILITGGTGGVGKEAMLQLLRASPRRIYFTGRNVEAAEAITSAHANTTFIPCKLDSLASTAAAAESFLAQEDRLDVFVSNAGIMAVPPATTEDGYEVQFGVNHLGNAALVLRLLHVMVKTAKEPGSDVRYVALTSLGYRGHPGKGVDFATLRSTGENFTFGHWARYGQAKLANIVFARELHRRYPSITSVVVHPGVVRTELVTGAGLLTRFLVHVTNPMGLMEPAEGGVNTVWAVASPDAKAKMAGEKVAFFEPVGRPNCGDKMCFDGGLMEELWKWTEEVVGVKGPK